MGSDRFAFEPCVWRKQPLNLPEKGTDCGVAATDNRLFPGAVLWPIRTGMPRRDPPAKCGTWSSVFMRFLR